MTDPNNAAPQTPANPDAQTETVETWDNWLAKQPEAERARIATLYEGHTKGLRTALDSERNERKQYEKQVRELATKAEKGSETEKRLTEMADALDRANRKADFYQEAAKPDTGLTDPEAAWIIANAKAEEFFDRKGNLNVALLKERHPGLFGRPNPTPQGNAGSGAGGQPQSGNDMNSYIRGRAGRG